MPKLPGPGLARARALPFCAEKTVYRVNPAAVRLAFARADVVSEGAVRGAEPTYFGSSSIVLSLPANERPHALALAESCLHVRTLAVRLARREAELRAQAPLGVLRCQVQVKPDARGVRLDIDLEAPLRIHAASEASAR